MILKTAPFGQTFGLKRRTLNWVLLVTCCGAALMAQNQGAAVPPSGSPLRVTHVLGFEGIPNNANGELSIQEHTLRFQKGDGAMAQIGVDSIQDLSLGVEDKQVGGTAAALGKAADTIRWRAID
jgi:hypothetical protein